MSDNVEIKKEAPDGNSATSSTKNILSSWSNNNLLGFFAFIISLGTFVTFAYQTYLIRNQTAMIQKQQYASVLPYLTIYVSNGKKPHEYAVIVQNNGVGPAFIKHIQVNYEGKTYEGDLWDFILKVVYPETPIKAARNQLLKGSVIPAGQAISMISAIDAETAKALQDLFENSKAKLEIVYASVFEETWNISSESGIPVKID